MKKSKLYLLLVILFVVLTAGIIVKYQNALKQESKKEYSLLPRKGNETVKEWETTTQKISGIKSCDCKRSK